MLSGTPMSNSWEEFAGQLMLLPGGGPFVDLDHYRRLFGQWDAAQEIAAQPEDS